MGLIAVWICLIFVIRQWQQNVLRARCAINLKQIGRLLQRYEDAHKCLPPAYFTDASGKPTLSWRVPVAGYYRYDLDFSPCMAFSQPWNSPTNAAFLDSLHARVLQCPALEKVNRTTTDYVAVVGPGTLWPGKEPGKLPARTKTGSAGKTRSPILVVEWPSSDIQWAEPRDVTVDEFLDRFRSKPGRYSSNHPGCILYVDAAGEVGEIPNDADPETVRKMVTCVEE